MSQADEDGSWESLADQLRAHGVPKRRAEIVARVAHGASYREVADAMGIESHGSVGNQIDEYRETLDNSEWLAEHAPDV